jgi:hypothetical protein
MFKVPVLRETRELLGFQFVPERTTKLYLLEAPNRSLFRFSPEWPCVQL